MMGELIRDLVQATSPHSPYQELRDHAHLYPAEVLANPILPLLSLEDPVLYDELVREAHRRLAVMRYQAAYPGVYLGRTDHWFCAGLSVKDNSFQDETPLEHQHSIHDRLMQRRYRKDHHAYHFGPDVHMQTYKGAAECDKDYRAIPC